MSFQIHPLADTHRHVDVKHLKKHVRNIADIAKPVASYDRNVLKAAKKCFDRNTSGQHVPPGLLESYRDALAQYHLYPETKFLNGRHRDRGPTERRHIKIRLSDVHYIGKEANELEEQVYFGFDPEAAA